MYRVRDELKYKELHTPNESIQLSIDRLRNHEPVQIDNNAFDYNAEDKAL